MKTIILVLVLHTTLSQSNKNAGSPVYEVINEQAARVDDKWMVTGPGQLPYGNPLAGNSLQNAKLHAMNQQAMFNAERVRQHRAQLQRWTKAPIKMDSYMRAYHESQENQQLALEQQQEVTTHRIPRRHRPDLRRNKGPDPMTITADDAIQSSRSHRSYGSTQYQMKPKRFKSVYVTPGPNMDEGVTIKPNGNAGIAQESMLYTQAIPSRPQYNQINSYEPTLDINNLNNLLKKEPQVQVNAINALQSDTLEKPIDIYFYLKDPNLSGNYNSAYAKIPNYGNYLVNQPQKDHKPITEDVNDIEDPNKHHKLPYEYIDANKYTANNIDSVLKNNSEAFGVQDYIPESQPLVYENPYISDSELKSNLLSGKQNELQHLNEAGVGVSAYNDELHYAANYEFGYRVRDHVTGNDFGHQEAKSNGLTKGQYHVLLPDGRMQTVQYHAGPAGFHADISYDLHL